MAGHTTLQRLEGWVSAQRLTKYRQATDPVALYEWNAELGAAVFELTGHAEVLLRNAIHGQLAARSETLAWYDDPYYRFNAQTRNDITKAKARAGAHGRRLTPGGVLAELTFGFWRYMLSATYQTTVWPRASHAFQGLPRSQRSRAVIERQMLSINDIRNRIAHQEPVFSLPSARLEADIVMLAVEIDPVAGAWIASVSRVATTLAARPS
ncbi:MAG: Abi family protein [Micrococcales bacterium]|nr:Abi family protein [Micrococcales bacterium]